MYETGMSKSIGSEPTKATPMSPLGSGLHELAEATRSLANASEEFLTARMRLTEARDRFNQVRDLVAKEQETAGL